MIALCALVLLVQSSAAAPEGGLVVHSDGGYFTALLAKAAGQERVPDITARWKLSVRDPDGRELWNIFHPGPKEGQRFLLAQDGSAFVVVEERFSDTQAVVHLRGPGERSERVFGGQLAIQPAALRAAEPAGSWLAAGDDSLRFSWTPGPFGPLQMLDLACVDGAVRQVEVASGLPLSAGGGQVAVHVEPRFEKDSVPPSTVPIVLSASAPAEVYGDEELIVTLEGTHPNPGWRVFAFGLEAGGADGRSLVIKPRARPPMPSALVIQRLEPYTAEARLSGLPPGELTLEVHGHEGPLDAPIYVTVHPGGALARLHVTGGMLGLDETITIYRNGVVGVESNRETRAHVAFADPRAFAAARGKLNALLPLPPGPSSPGADFMNYTLSWRLNDSWRQVSGDDGSVRGELRQAIDAVLAVAHGG